MRAPIITIALGICALAIPVSANAEPSASPDYSSVNAITGDSGESSQAAGGSDSDAVPSNTGFVAPDHTSLNASLAPSEGTGTVDEDSGYSSLNAITGAPTSTPTFVSGSPDSGDGFDWGSGLVGAGAALALAALGTAAMLTLRRRTVSASASTG